MSLLQKRHVLEALERAKANKAKKYRDTLPTWCPGCGHFTPLQGLYEALETLGIPAKDYVLVSGIGCSGRFPFFIKGFGVHALHGRALPVATGVKIANPDLTVVVVGGDGDGVGIGGGHFPHAARNNLDMTYLLLDNSIYGLTKGQTSPTSPLGMVSSTTPYGNFGRPLNPTTMALTYGATYVSRVFARDRDLCTNTIVEAMKHPGFSFIHVLSPCIEFNKTVTYESVKRDVQMLPDSHDTTDHVAAMTLAESDDPIYQGLYFQARRPTFQENVKGVVDMVG